MSSIVYSNHSECNSNAYIWVIARCDKDRGATVCRELVPEGSCVRPLGGNTRCNTDLERKLVWYAGRSRVGVDPAWSALKEGCTAVKGTRPQFHRNQVECGPPEELDARNRSKKWLPRALQARPQVRQGCPQVQLGSTDEQDARICNAGSESGRNARGDHARCRIWGEYRSCPGFQGGFMVVPWIRAWAVGISRRNEGGDHEWRRGWVSKMRAWAWISRAV
ncbi:hypothetical protein FB451DRAFT_1190886 [Mycena latifolia]|nr:hypothetical protein FB451DRAFT_1190886 [Mycena latifolia]